MRRALVLVSNLATNNGVASCIMNHYEKLHTVCDEIDFLVLWEIEPNRISEVKRFNDRVFVLPEYEKYYSTKKNNFLSSLIRDRKYEIVHVNVPNHNGTTVLFHAVMNKVPVRIYHAHAQKVVDTTKNKLKALVFDNLCRVLSNFHIACSETVGMQMFGKNGYDILHNAIDADKFIFNASKREEIRQKYQIGDGIVLGAVCRMTAIKNPLFIIDIVEKLNKNGINAFLLWLGSGEMREEIEEYSRTKKIYEKCYFIGSRDDVFNWYSAMDIFLFPSLAEGLGMSLIEAQVSGLPCYASDNVPIDTKITDNVRYLSLELSAEKWAEDIMKNLPDVRKSRESQLQDVRSHDFDSKYMKNDLKYLYNKYLHSCGYFG